MNTERKTMNLSPKASFEQFCDHYDLVPSDVESRLDYNKYVNMLAFTQSLFIDANERGEL